MKLQQTTLSNGIPLAYYPMEGVKSVFIAIDVYAGGYHDRPGLEGEHHAFEHMPFRGTKLFPDKLAWALPLERHAAQYNANTGKERTRYFVTVPSDQLELGCVHVGELAFGALLRPEDWLAEREAIKREWEQAQGNQQRIRGDMLRKLLHPDEPRMHESVLGNLDTIQSITADHLFDLRTREYGFKNCRVVVAGALPNDVVTIVNRTVGTWNLPQGADLPREMKVPSPVPEIRLRHELFVPPKLAIVFLHRIPTARERIARNIFCAMIGSGGMASPLFQELREKRGLVYSFSLDRDPYLGLYEQVFSTMTSTDKLAQVIEIFWDVVERTKRDAERFAFARDASISAIRMAAPNPTAMGEIVADCLMSYGNFLDADESEALVRSLTFEEVATVAERVFRRDQASTVITNR